MAKKVDTIKEEALEPSSLIANQPSPSSFSTIASTSEASQIVGPPDFSDKGGAGGFFGVSIQQRGTNEALIAKMTPAHIEKIIDTDSNDKKWRHIQELANSIIGVVAFVFTLIAIVVLCLVFLMFNKPEFLQGILGLLIGVLGGGGAGYGIGRATASKPQKSSQSR